MSEVIENTEEATEVKTKFLNPFDSGVTYVDFLASVPKGKSVEDYCKGNLEAEQIEWLLKDLEHVKKITQKIKK